jgi:hypothetical protein
VTRWQPQMCSALRCRKLARMASTIWVARGKGGL